MASKAVAIKKMVISYRNDDNQLIPVRSVNLTGEFIGVGTHGQNLVVEYSNLAEVLEPNLPRRSFVIMDI